MANKSITILAFALITGVLLAISVYAQNVPVGVEEITVESSSTGAYRTPESTDAEAGNLTELSIRGVSQTKSWQGFYGNISGTIVLENSLGFRFYDWNAAEPQGEIYASVNDTVTWTDVTCAPTHTDAAYLDLWQTFYGMNISDYDSINHTYNRTDHPSFMTGYISLTGCPTTYTYVSNQSQLNTFPAALLATDANTTLIFSTIIENKSEGVREGVTGYDGGDYDFQLLVAEFGSDQNSDLTTYYFWVEIQ